MNVMRECPEVMRLLISSSIIFFKYRIVNKKMIVKNLNYDR